jgi:cleavage and polyadenylation specificity factor subunit 1
LFFRENCFTLILTILLTGLRFKVVEDSDEVPEKNLFIGVGASVIAHDGEDIASKGRLLLFQIKKSKKRALSKGGNLPSLILSLKTEKDMALGPVTCLSSLKSENIHRVVIGAGAEVTVEQWGNGKLTQVGE